MIIASSHWIIVTTMTCSPSSRSIIVRRVRIGSYWCFLPYNVYLKVDCVCCFRFPFPIEHCWWSPRTFIGLYCSVFKTFADFCRVHIQLNWSVTLIALANGAPDALTAFVASSSEEGVLMAVGSIFGAGLFVTTVVVGRVIQLSGTVKVSLLFEY
jgi:hypothetical protein